VSLQAADASFLEVRDICVNRGGHPVINIPLLSVEAHRILTLIGPNGSGKSTLMLTLASLLKPYQGALLFRGRLLTRQAHGRLTAKAFPWCFRNHSC